MNYLDRLEEAIKLTKAEAEKRAKKAEGSKKRAGGEEEKAISTLRTFSGATPEEREKAEEKREVAARRRSRAAFVQGGREAQAKLAAESYQQIGDILAEAMLGKIRSKVARGLKGFAQKQYRKGEVDDASGKPRRAKVRGKVAHVAGKLAQKVEPKDEG
jgi:hypothetical protein